MALFGDLWVKSEIYTYIYFNICNLPTGHPGERLLCGTWLHSSCLWPWLLCSSGTGPLPRIATTGTRICIVWTSWWPLPRLPWSPRWSSCWTFSLPSVSASTAIWNDLVDPLKFGGTEEPTRFSPSMDCNIYSSNIDLRPRSHPRLPANCNPTRKHLNCHHRIENVQKRSPRRFKVLCASAALFCFFYKLNTSSITNVLSNPINK